MKRIFYLFFSILFIGNGLTQTGYQRSNKTDIPVFAVSTLILGTGIYTGQKVQPLSEKEVAALNPLNVNRFDRWACSRWSPRAAHLSDALLITSFLSPGLLFTSSQIQKDSKTVGMMYFESMILTFGLTQLTKSLTQRIRPVAYHPDAPDDFRLNNRDVRASFFSGHTSMAFASLVFLSTVYDRYHSDSEWTPFVWGGAIGTASTVGLLRILSGKHFPTDVIVGAVVGGAAGYFIPKLHEVEDKKSGAREIQGLCVNISIPL